MTEGVRVVALLDANVLYPAAPRDLFVRLAQAGAYSARWTARIHDEWVRSLLRDRPDLSPARLRRSVDLMNHNLPGALVEDYEHRVPAIHLPDPDDAHVLAAAIEGDATVIVTFNLRDFPQSVTKPAGIIAEHPDQFIVRLLRSDPGRVCSAARSQRQGLRNPPLTIPEYIHQLNAANLPLTGKALLDADFDVRR